MRYNEFRDRFQDALREAELFFQYGEQPIEIIDLASTSRRWKLYIRLSAQNPEPFHVSAKISFNWSPVNAARAYTCEEDLLTELIGRKQRPAKTEQRWARVNLALYATLPYGSTTPIPDPQIFGSWTGSAGEKLDKWLTEFKERQGRVVAVTGGREEVEVEARSNAEGVLFLKGVSVSGFRIVRVPRVWDDPDRREAEKDIDEELARLARRFKDALDEWTRSVAELARWIRYAPPPPEAKPVEPWFEDENGGPETIH
ncbi:MAG: hypothetical protein HY646_12440 [Acidobacteria bacterium]|nr:hypothetical protein [Acidobacteriota bacterium]